MAGDYDPNFHRHNNHFCSHCDIIGPSRYLYPNMEPHSEMFRKFISGVILKPLPIPALERYESSFDHKHLDLYSGLD